MNENRISGIHHITAIASSPAENLEFYEQVLGLRLVKQTVNFDDPYTYHLYYGDGAGSPGTILTFFPWEGIPKGESRFGDDRRSLLRDSAQFDGLLAREAQLPEPPISRRSRDLVSR